MNTDHFQQGLLRYRYTYIDIGLPHIYFFHSLTLLLLSLGIYVHMLKTSVSNDLIDVQFVLFSEV